MTTTWQRDKFKEDARERELISYLNSDLIIIVF